MVHFFGIFDLGKLPRQGAPEAPAKASFFGGTPDVAWAAVYLSRAEQDACYLSGKSPEREVLGGRDPLTEAREK